MSVTVRRVCELLASAVLLAILAVEVLTTAAPVLLVLFPVVFFSVLHGTYAIARHTIESSREASLFASTEKMENAIQAACRVATRKRLITDVFLFLLIGAAGIGSGLLLFGMDLYVFVGVLVAEGVVAIVSARSHVMEARYSLRKQLRMQGIDVCSYCGYDVRGTGGSCPECGYVKR